MTRIHTSQHLSVNLNDASIPLQYSYIIQTFFNQHLISHRCTTKR